jgi:triosephosphate isomerase (TIM)
MRKKIIAGNWKMNKTPSEAGTLALELVEALRGADKAEVVICPPYIALDRVKSAISGTHMKLGAQDLHWQNQGAYTGKISADMLLSISVQYVIIGHSEQRTYFHETDETVNLKTKKSIESGLIPLVCVGETLEEREKNLTESVIEKQIRGAYNGISSSDAEKTVIAYEPVWAIGTGKTATPAQAQEVHLFIRKLIASLYSAKIADGMRILYGGSMKADNASGLLSEPDIDGGLIGGASLVTKDFKAIVDAAQN